MSAVILILVSLGVFAIGYRFYGLFIARNVLQLNGDRPTPAVTMSDGHDYVKTNRYVLFGHHFAAIAAAGPLLGPVLAAQFGYLPGALWIIFGAVFAGAVHDMIVLFASVRHKGRSLAHIAEQEVGKRTGFVASFAVLFILILTLAGFSLAVMHAMVNSAWAAFTVAATIPIGLLMGVYIHIGHGSVKIATLVGVVLLVIALIIGSDVAAHPILSSIFLLNKQHVALCIPIYGFIASVLPVWLLLCPRDYLSTYLKIGTIAMLACGICVARPHFLMPALTPFIHGGGPIIHGKLFPFIFITIACGALSGFHAVISTGTTPKMIANERDILFVGYGALLVEGFVAIMALTAACVLVPADYFAINATADEYRLLGMTPVNLDMLSREVGETLQGRTGGAVSLAVGMAYLFAHTPFMEHLMRYWYHFAIMFEAVFVLTAIDTGTRIGRFFLQEMIGARFPKFLEKKWIPGIIITSFLFTFSWGYLVYTGDISSIWPIFGITNQLLAATALIICTTLLIRMNKLKYAWITAVPGLCMAVITLIAGYDNIVENYVPQQQYLLMILSIVIMCLMMFVVVTTLQRWWHLVCIHTTVRDAYGEEVREVVGE